MGDNFLAALKLSDLLLAPHLGYKHPLRLQIEELIEHRKRNPPPHLKEIKVCVSSAPSKQGHPTSVPS
jgi:hypothetical protein